jgi:hypothetical protein
VQAVESFANIPVYRCRPKTLTYGRYASEPVFPVLTGILLHYGYEDDRFSLSVHLVTILNIIFIFGCALHFWV